MSSPFNVSKMPKMKICYICGREFGSQSLPIHQKQCLKKRELEQSRLPKHLRTPLQKPQETGNNAADRDAAFDAYKDNLVPCKLCGRTFLPDRLAVHSRSCKGPTKRSVSPRGSRPSPSASKPRSSAAASSSRSSARVGGGGSARSAPRESIARQSSRAAEPEEDDGPIPPPASYEVPDDGSAMGSVGNLTPCNLCGRKFAPDRIAKHENACKIANKKRKVLDPSKMRTAGTEMKSVKGSSSSSSAKAAPKSNWRAKHAELQAAMKASRQVSKALKEGGPLPEYTPSAPDPSYVQCPHCQRRFNDTAAQRHIPHCKNTINRPKPPPKLRSSGSSASSGSTSARGAPSARRPAAKSSGYGQTRATSPRGTAKSSGYGQRATSPRRGAPAAAARRPAAGASGSGGAAGARRPAFCGECGSKYSTSTQKFCGDCGNKR